jgi:hypothetical protein
MSTLMVRRRVSAVSSHETRAVASSFETRFALLRTRG